MSMRFSARYALFMALKLLAGAGLMAALVLLINALSPPPPGLLHDWPRLGTSWPYTLAIGLWVLGGYGLLRLSIWDQRFRCRTCLRRLRLPLTEGIYSSVWLGGAPYTEYVCTWGHGKFYIPDIHLASGRKAMWVAYESLWENLVKAETEAVDK